MKPTTNYWLHKNKQNNGFGQIFSTSKQHTHEAKNSPINLIFQKTQFKKKYLYILFVFLFIFLKFIFYFKFILSFYFKLFFIFIFVDPIFLQTKCFLVFFICFY